MEDNQIVRGLVAPVLVPDIECTVCLITLAQRREEVLTPNVPTHPPC